jgi:hypothetical protein
MIAQLLDWILMQGMVSTVETTKKENGNVNHK